MLIFAIIAGLAVVQSLFGIGLLVFGTPTLLLLGYPYQQALAILLPASLAVSLLQLRAVPRLDRSFALQFAGWCLAPLAVTLAAVSLLHLRASLNLAVALALSFFVMLRLFPDLESQAASFLRRHQKAWLVLMGMTHGISNLGGSLLTILANALQREKEQVRSVIVHCYVCFALVQLTVLGLTTPHFFSWRQLAYAAASAGVFLVVGRQIFDFVSAPAFRRLFTGFMASYAGLLGLRAAGIL
ncbi:MAG TPA: TSUP family transporter [Rhizomicrobium sp.]|nr:TSUP family transporter [Rhizomicrobium sp.]